MGPNNSPKSHFQIFWGKLFGHFSRLFPELWDSFSRLFGRLRDSLPGPRNLNRTQSPKNLLRLFFALKIIFISRGYFENPSKNALKQK